MNVAFAESPSSIDAIVERLRSRVSPARFEQMETLVRLFFQRVPDEDMGLRSVAGWASLVSGVFDFLQMRKAESARMVTH